MNAVLQQLFMTREFRYPVLGVEVEDKGEGKERNGRKYYSVLYELRRMFAYLELSERGEYNPEGFCYAFDGNIQLSNQEDSQEFLSNLFDKLERELKSTHLKKLLSSVYGGQTISTILCESCNTPTYR
jgi:ubiquitin C-terminal hydrolase